MMPCEHCGTAPAVALVFVAGSAPCALCRECGRRVQDQAQRRGLRIQIDEMKPEPLQAPPPLGRAGDT